MNVERRAFFRQLLSDVIVSIEELRGRPHIKISDLVQAPDSELKKVIPVFRKDSSHRIEDGKIFKKDRKTRAYLKLYHMNPQEAFFLQYFDGKHTLEEIGRIGESEFGLKSEDSYGSVKALFCNLATRFVCQPLDSTYPANESNDESQLSTLQRKQPNSC